MIRKYTFGTPFPTGAVVQSLEAAAGEVPFFETGREGEKVIFRRTMTPEEMIFGLGENVRGMNKRGHLYRAWNTDMFNHSENQPSLYASHNFLIFFRPGQVFGVYFDDPGLVTFDLGESHGTEAVITSENGNLDVYLLEGHSARAIAREFRQLTGGSYTPPRWAFGYIQSRWGYAGEEAVRAVVENHRQRHIPLDGVCLDIDYMVDYKNFSWKPEFFPDWKAFNGEMKERHIRLIPIIDAGIKQEEGYAPYDSGKARDVFCKKEDGSDFIASVWPGMCAFPDFLNPEAREWFGDLYQPLLEEGIEGFWNDMNEPALFFTEDSLREGFAKAEYQRQHLDDYEGMWALGNVFSGMANNPADYRRFYHQTPQGKICHDQVHNIYGAGMTHATAEGIRRYQPDRRYLLFSRSSFIGAHRDGGVWQGDNFSWWSHIKMAMQMMPGLNMSGFLFSGCDLGGFGMDTTEDLLARFLQLGVFTPLMRNHSALHTRDQEIYRFDSWEGMRDTVTVRYALLPYLYSEFMKAALRDEMYFRPLAFDYPQDGRACRVEDQLMLGEDCMIAPVYEPNAVGRYVYLPEDMLMIRFRSGQDYDLEPLEKSDHYIALGLHEFPLFVKKGRFALLCGGGECTEELDDTRLTALGWVEGPAQYELYRDDGVSVNPQLEEGLTTLQLQGEAGKYVWQIDR
ncbi:MAG: alpha-glucosidase [Clostridia bacterium]|nr:alpha-glucosidase [Clostridia bacterium]